MKIKKELREYLRSESIISAIKTVPFLSEDAREIVRILESHGLVNVQPKEPSSGDIDSLSFLRDFWNYDTSTYVKDRLVHKKMITKKHCYDMGHRLVHWEGSRAG